MPPRRPGRRGGYVPRGSGGQVGPPLGRDPDPCGRFARSALLCCYALVARPDAGRPSCGTRGVGPSGSFVDRPPGGRGAGRNVRGRLDTRRHKTRQRLHFAGGPRNAAGSRFRAKSGPGRFARLAILHRHGQLPRPRVRRVDIVGRHSRRHLQPGRNVLRNARRPSAVRGRRPGDVNRPAPRIGHPQPTPFRAPHPRRGNPPGPTNAQQTALASPAVAA